MKVIEEFKSFAMKGNVVDMAIGVIVGGVNFKQLLILSLLHWLYLV